MKRIIWIGFLVLTLAVSGLAAPPKSFRIVYYKGQVLYSVKTSPYIWKKPATDTMQFKPAWYLKLGSGSEVVLAGDNNASFRLKKPGTYQLSSLSSPEKSSVLMRYLSYVADALFHHEGADLEKQRLDYMEILGGVPRGAPCMTYGPASGYLAGDTITFSWSNPELREQVFLLYADMDGQQELFRKTISDSVFRLTDSEYAVPIGKACFWLIYDDGDYKECAFRHFIKVEDAAAKKVEDGAAALKAGLKFSPGINALMMAYYYAEQGWSDEAVKYFNEAQQMESGSPAVISAKEYFEERTKE